MLVHLRPSIPSPSAPHTCPAAPFSGEVLLGDLYRSGFEVVKEHEDADAIIVNTCAFVEDAKAESLEVRAGSGWRSNVMWLRAKHSPASLS